MPTPRLNDKNLLHRWLAFVLTLQMTLVPAFAFADGPLVVHGPVGLSMEPNCSVVSEPNAEFRMTEPHFGAQTYDTTLFRGSLTAGGYLPKNSLVEVQPSDAESLSLTSLVSIKVVAVPDYTKTKLVYDDNVATVIHPGYKPGNAATVGTIAHVSQGDLLPYVGAFVNPGAVFDDSKQIFMVRRDTPYFKIPELEGRAVRLAQYGPMYLAKRCCPQGAPSDSSTLTTVINSVSRYPVDLSHKPGCYYHPVFELLKDAGHNGTVNLVPEKQFAMPFDTQNPSCSSFVSGLQAVSAEDLTSVFARVAAADRISNDALAKLQQAAAAEATKRRCVDTDPQTQQCLKWKGGNVSKGLCRQGVIDTLHDLHKLPQNERGPIIKTGKPLHVRAPASLLSPWLSKSAGFKELKGYNSRTAPPGSILVYAGGPSGHVEIKTDDSTWCSDYCTDHPRDFSRSGSPDKSRTLIGVYQMPEGN